MKKILEEFKTFALRGNVIDLAVGVIIGAALGQVVTSLVADVIMPPVGWLIGGVNFSDLKWVLKGAETGPDGALIPAVTLNYGHFLQTVFDFLVVAVVIFGVVRVVNRLRPRSAEKPLPKESAEVGLLKEIRDLLRKEQ